MRIAYVCYWDLHRFDGVAKKITSQIDFWRGDGHDVRLLCLTPSEPENGAAKQEGLYPAAGIRRRLFATRALAADLDRAAPDLVYLRYDLFLPPLWPALTKRRVVVELNAQPAQLQLRRSTARLYERICRRFVLSRADGFVCIAHELADGPWLRRLHRPTIVLGNSIEPDDYPQPAPPGNSRPRGVFIGGPGMPWHGVDKVRRLAELLPEVDFDVIGPSAAALGGPAPANLTTHGFLARAEYEPLLTRADFGIGTLALHREGATETAPLKLREYLAYGLPIIVAQEDPDLTRAPSWFVLRIANEESNVETSAETIRSWIGQVVGRRVPRSVVQELVGAKTKERERLRFLSEVAGQPSFR